MTDAAGGSRRNLEKGGGKTLARRTEIMSGRKRGLRKRNRLSRSVQSIKRKQPRGAEHAAFSGLSIFMLLRWH